jgi:uncharacterized protein
VEDDYTIIYSPLQQRVTRSAISVDVMIYRGEQDKGWVLEVVDHLGGSTVWDDPFPTDQAALDEALATIKAEDIGSFAANEGRTSH